MFRIRSMRIGTAPLWRRRSAGNNRGKSARGLAVVKRLEWHVALDGAHKFKDGGIARAGSGIADPFACRAPKFAASRTRGGAACTGDHRLADGGDGWFIVRRRAADP